MFNEKIWISKFWIFCKAITKENHYFLVFNVAPAFNPGYKWNRNSNKIVIRLNFTKIDNLRNNSSQLSSNKINFADQVIMLKKA